jgi:phage tail sheath protein FI
MPVAPTYPGVYIEEIPSGVRTITGVPTSVTAFIGRTLRGPINKPKTINNFGDFERIFGGLWIGSTLGYTVRDFYKNGGSQAIIVRLFNPYYATKEDRTKADVAAEAVADAATGTDAQTAAAAARTKADEYDEEPEKSAADIIADAAEKAASEAGADADSVKRAADNAVKETFTFTFRTSLTVGGLTLEAAYPGSWGEYLRATIDVNVSQEVAGEINVAKEDLFNLTVKDARAGGTVEQYLNLTVKDTIRRIDRVLEAESKLVRYKDDPPVGMPDAIKDAHKATEEEKRVIYDKVTSAQKALAKKKLEEPNGDISQEENTLKKAKKELKTSDGVSIDKNSFIGPDKEAAKEGLYALEDVDIFNLLCLPPYKNDRKDVDESLIATAAAFCEIQRAILIVDPPSSWKDKDKARDNKGKIGTNSKNAALFFPRLRQPDPLREDRLSDFVPCGVVAGIFARTDVQRGVWKAPAGLEATMVGVPQLSVTLTDEENGELNPLGINCLRTMPAAGRVIWGSRTLQGDDRLASEWKYIPVRRLALHIEESLYRGTQWVVFEPNDEPLWAQIRLNIGAFMHNLFRQGAFQGTTPREAYFVKCDSETTTQNERNLGIVNIVVGFAPLKPAEFVIIKIQQMAGQIEV